MGNLQNGQNLRAIFNLVEQVSGLVGPQQSQALPVIGPQLGDPRTIIEANRQLQSAELERREQAQRAEQFAIAENVAEQDRLQKALEFEKTQALSIKLDEMKEKRAVAKAEREAKETKRKEGVDVTTAEVRLESEKELITSREAARRESDRLENLLPLGPEEKKIAEAQLGNLALEKIRLQGVIDAAVRKGDGTIDAQEETEFSQAAFESNAKFVASISEVINNSEEARQLLLRMNRDSLRQLESQHPGQFPSVLFTSLMDERAETATTTGEGPPQVGAGVVEDVEQPAPSTISVRKTAEETTIDEFIESTAKEQVAVLKEQAGTLGIVDRFLKFLKESLPTPTEEETTRKELEGSLRSALFELRKGGLTNEESEVEKGILNDIKALRKTRQLPGFRRVL